MAGLQAQNPVIDVRQIALISPVIKSEGLLLGGSFAECITTLGKPDSISDVYSEMDEDTLKLYSYGKCKLYFLKGKLDAWHLLDDKIAVGQANGRMFKVGDQLKPTTGKPMDFQGFAITHYDGESQNMRFKSASLNWIKSGETQLDCILELLFDSEGNLFSISKLNP
ncbi:hypothetical protein GCM10011325_25800 [Dyadobacter sediminis]|nr:hypothetical protein GCM10011325_25800 [Dyadobacter sediminis]